MTSDKKRRRSQWKRLRSFRQLRHILLALSILGMMLGAGLVVWGIYHGYKKILLLGITYILFSLAILCVREVLARVDKLKKKKASRRYR